MDSTIEGNSELGEGQIILQEEETLSEYLNFHQEQNHEKLEVEKLQSIETSKKTRVKAKTEGK